MSQTSSEIAHIIHQIFQDRSRAEDGMHERRSRAMRDQVLIEDPIRRKRFKNLAEGERHRGAKNKT